MDLTQILKAVQAGDSEARASLIQAAYDELRKLAAGKMADQRPDHTLTATALVHELSVRMLDNDIGPVGNKAQFFAYASKAMRNMLIDHARAKGTQKRGGGRQKFSFEEAMVACTEQSQDLLALNDALNTLADLDPRRAEVVEMRYFGGLSNHEIACALDISVATVKRDWDIAKALLLHELRRDTTEEMDRR